MTLMPDIGDTVLPVITEADYQAVRKFAPSKGPGTLVGVDHDGHPGHPFKVEWSDGSYSFCCEVKSHG